MIILGIMMFNNANKLFVENKSKLVYIFKQFYFSRKD